MCAFGILVRRWGILWRKLEMRFERRAQVIIASARLYNLCINKRIKDDLCEKAGLTEI